MAKSFWRQKVPIHTLFHPKYHFHTPNSGGAMFARKLSSKNETTFFADFLRIGKRVSPQQVHFSWTIFAKILLKI